jgi:hypothetical protein
MPGPLKFNLTIHNEGMLNMRIHIKIFPILVTMVVMLVMINNSIAQQPLFDMEGQVPNISLRIEGAGVGQQKIKQDSIVYHSGKASLCWEYELPQNPQGNYPTIDIAIPTVNQNWKGKDKIGIWLYIDAATPKTYWTIQPILVHSVRKIVTELGNWDVGEKGIPPKTWVYHEWTFPSGLDLSQVTNLRLYYHAGDGWKEVAKSNKVTINIDDISLITKPIVSVKGQPMNPPSARFNLSFSRDSQTGKAIYLLNNVPFCPVAYFSGSQVTPEFIDQIRGQGCNAIMLGMDVDQAYSEQLKKALEICKEKNIPTFVEVGDWSVWNKLRSDLSLNMVMLNGQPVKYFPDYANPMIREEHLKAYKKAAEFLKSYAHSPIIGISLGAYDGYHLPDGEIHLDFKIPSHPEKKGTYLPYGHWVEKEFNAYLVNQGKKPFQPVGNTRLPSTLQTAGSSEMWKDWILFRRAYVKQWLGDTLALVRKESGLPVTATFDINFSLQERFATPPFDWTDIMDFYIVYYYGRVATEFIPKLLRTVYKEFNDAEKPMITLLEFSSAGGASGIDYTKESAPYVSGFMTSGPIKTYRDDDAQKSLRRNHDEERVNSYLSWIKSNSDRLMKLKPQTSEVLILVDKASIYFENPFSDALSLQKIPYDIQYVQETTQNLNFKPYKYVLIPGNFSSVLANRLKQKNGNILWEKENPDWLQKLGVKDESVNLAQWKIDTTLVNATFDSATANMLWNISLSLDSWKIKDGILQIRKSNQNVRGFASNAVFKPPVLIEAVMALRDGNPRITFLDSALYPVSQAGHEPSIEANELSIGADISKSQESEWGVFLNDWVKVGEMQPNINYLWKIYLLPHSLDKDLLYVALYSGLEQKPVKPIKTYSTLIPKRKEDRLWLLWAYDDAGADIDTISIHNLTKK